jgi:hypothetical protein
MYNVLHFPKTIANLFANIYQILQNTLFESLIGRFLNEWYYN